MGDGKNMVSTKAARGKAPLRTEAVLLWQKDYAVINKGLGCTDGLGIATVGGYKTQKKYRKKLSCVPGGYSGRNKKKISSAAR